MVKLRIYEIAKELGVDNSIIIEKLKEHGVSCDSSLSTIDADNSVINTVKMELTMNKKNENKKSEEEKIQSRQKEEVSSSAEETVKTEDRQKEELSIFFRKNSNDFNTPEDDEYETSDNDDEDVSPASNSSLDEIPMAAKNGSGLITTTLGIIGFFISVIAIVFTLNLYSKTWLVPQTVKTMIKSQSNSSNSYNMLRLRVEGLEAKLNSSKKLRVQREIDVLKYLAKQSKGETKAKLETIGSSLALLLNEMNK